MRCICPLIREKRDMEMKYEVMELPFKFHQFDELSKKQADRFYKWYVGQISHRIDVLKNMYISKKRISRLIFHLNP